MNNYEFPQAQRHTARRLILIGIALVATEMLMFFFGIVIPGVLAFIALMGWGGGVFAWSLLVWRKKEQEERDKL